MSEALESKLCLYPFSRVELGHQRDFVPCCTDWLADDYFSLDPGADLWNGPQAQALRKSIFEGSFKYCKRHLCKIPLFNLEEIKKDLLIGPESPISEKTLADLIYRQAHLSEGPLSLAIAVDKRCNLACPSCRSDLILKLDDFQSRAIERAVLFMQSVASSLTIIKMAADGEVFFSPFLRSLLKNFSKEKFPKLDHIFVLSNGILCDEKTFEALKPGSDFIRKVMISIDAGNETTYKAVRGGNWNRLMKNLKWLSQLRKANRLDWFAISFVVRRANFETIPEFVELGESLGVDRISFTSFYDWVHSSIPDFNAENVYDKLHPHHDRFLSLYNRYNSYDRIVFADP